MKRLIEGIKSLPSDYQDKIIAEYIRLKEGLPRKYSRDKYMTAILNLYDSELKLDSNKGIRNLE